MNKLKVSTVKFDKEYNSKSAPVKIDYITSDYVECAPTNTDDYIKDNEYTTIDDEIDSVTPSNHPEFKPSYGDIPSDPTQEGPKGIFYDFNIGLRVKVPADGPSYRVVFTDAVSGLQLFESVVPPGMTATCSKKFYIKYVLHVYTTDTNELVFSHTFNPTDKLVLIQCCGGGLGDSLAWFSYVDRFREKNKCRLICAVNPGLKEILYKQYPNIRFITREETRNYKPYATYYLGLFFFGDNDKQPIDFRYTGLHKTAAHILNVDDAEEAPKFDLSAPRQIKEPYVCIATQSTTKCKYWNNPYGWYEVIRFLKGVGYRVLAIDRKNIDGNGIHMNQMPIGAEDFTGDLPLQERINLIKDADLFIGLSSGLTWLAWGCKVPIVLISGFTEPFNEFYTPYRVTNYFVCHGCWNDLRENFDHHDYMYCPRKKGTDGEFECTRLITGLHVINTIKQIPSFKLHMENKVNGTDKGNI